MGEKTKVVIDTNIFISGFGWNGKPKEVLNLLEDGFIANFATTETFEEIRKVVSYPRLKFPTSLQIKIIEFAFSYSRFVDPGKTVSLIKEDPEDNRFLECAVSARADFIITGDPHLLKVGNFMDIRITTAAQFLKSRTKK